MMNFFLPIRTATVQMIVMLWVMMLVLPKFASANSLYQEIASTTTPTTTAVPPAQIQVEASVTVANQIATYTLYPTNTARQSAWNVLIRVPLAADATFLNAGTTAPFTLSFDGQAVIFYTPELGPRTTNGPLVFQIVLPATPTVPLVVEPELSWQTLQTVMRQSTLRSDAARSGPYAIQPDGVRQAVFDPAGDVAVAGYDLTGLSLEKEGASLKIIFTTAGVLGTTSEASEFYLYLDSDCDPQTGKLKTGRGIDYRVRYRHGKAQADVSDWLPNAGTDKVGDWGNARSVSVSASTDGTTVTVWVPLIAFQEDRFFCWLAEAQRKADPAVAKSPKDELPDFSKDPRLTAYRAWDETTGAFAIGSITNTTSYSESSPGELLWAGLQPFKGEKTSALALTGKIALPVVVSDTSEIQIWSVTDSQLLTTIPNARQPDFRADGAKLLFQSTVESAATVNEYDLAAGAQTAVSEGIQVAMPAYHAAGNRVVYAGVSSTLTNTNNAPIFVQCSVSLPSAESEENCRKLVELGRLTGDTSWGDVIGSDPLWSADDQILFRSCPVWDGLRRCGIYSILATSTLSNTIHTVPSQLVDDPTAIPTDTQGPWLTFMAESAGQWDVYAMTLDGSWLQNLSNNINAQDGLPAISPDGQWVAFVSNRGGQWALWATPIYGGDAHKLFDLPGETLWNQDTLRWAMERISWGP